MSKRSTITTRSTKSHIEGAPPVIRTRTELPDISAITLEDREFIKRVFNQVKDVDFRSAPPPPPRKNLAGLDKKMQFLRDRVRELERDLARVGWIWSIKQRQVDAVDQVLESKENERASAVARYTTLRDQAAASAQTFRTEETRLNNMINEGVANASRLEGENAGLRQEMEATVEDLKSAIEREQEEKNNLIADFRNKIETAQAAFNQLRDTSHTSLADSEARINALDYGSRWQPTDRSVRPARSIRRAHRAVANERSQSHRNWRPARHRLPRPRERPLRYNGRRDQPRNRE